MGYQLIAADLDGILRKSGRRLNKSFLQAIRTFSARGGKLIAATERSASAVRQYLETLQIVDNYHIFHNGALICNPKTNEVLFESNLNRELCADLFRMAGEYGFNPIVYYHDQVFVSRAEKQIIRRLESEHSRYILVDCYPLLNPEQVIKIVCYGNQCDLQSIVRQISAKHPDAQYLLDNNRNMLMILASGANKSSALQKIAAHLSIDSKACLMIGDVRPDPNRLIPWKPKRRVVNLICAAMANQDLSIEVNSVDKRSTS